MKRVLLFLFLLAAATGYSQYCTTGLYSTTFNCGADGDEIDDFSFGSFSHLGTGCGNSSTGFSDYTSMTITVTQTLPQSLTVTSTYDNGGESLKLFIDYNNDQDFDDTGEEVYVSPNTFGGTVEGPLNDIITFPAGSPVGTFRMRARLVFTTTPSSITPCGNFTYGETHDYTIQINPNIEGDCADFFSNFEVDSISGTAAKVDWTPGATNASYYFEYGPVGFTPGSAAAIAKHTGTYPGSEPPLILTGLSPQTTYDYYFGEICNSGADSAYYPLVKQFTTTKLCASPTDFTLAHLASDSVYLTWNQAGSVQEYWVIWGPAGFDPFTQGTIDTVTNRSYSLNGLSPVTAYDFYLATNCAGGNGISDTIGPLDAITPLQSPQGVTCPASNYTTLLSEQFDDNNANIWSGDIGTFAGQWIFDNSGSINTGPASAYSGSGYVHWDASAAGPASLISPAINLVQATDAAELTFWMHAYGDDVGYLVIRVSTAGSSGPFNDTVFLYNVGQLQSSASEPWQQVGVNLSSYLGQTIWLEFEADRANPDFHGDIALDLLEVNTCGNYCLPEIFSLDSIVPSSNDAMVYVDTSGSNFQLEWGPCGYAQGTGTFVSGTSPFSLTGLTANTCYDVYVRRDCGTGNGFSGWGGPFSFKTDCSGIPLPAPYLETFDGPSWVGTGSNSGNEIDVCWSANPDMSQGSEPFKWIPYDSNPSSLNGPTTDVTGGNFMYVETSGTTSGDIATLTSPLVDVSTLTTPAVYFWQHRYSGGNIADMDIEVTNDDGATWTTVYSINGDIQSSAGDAWDDHYVILPAFAGDTIRVRFKQIGTGCCGDAAIDSVAIAEAPSCPEAAGLAAYNISDSSASVTWTGPPQAISYQVWYGPQGFYTGPHSTTGGTKVFVSGDSLDLAGLIPSTTYDFVVRAICGPGDTALWSDPSGFTTLACKMEESCNFTVNLYDSFGDGWNGAEISFYQKGGIVATLGQSFSTGSQVLNIQVPICDSSMTYVVLTNGGSFPSEIGFDVTSPYPLLVASHSAGTVATGDTLASFMASCALPSCPKPTALDATGLNPDSVTLSWTPAVGGGLGYEISYGSNIAGPAAGTIISVSDTSYNLTGLGQGDNVCYFVREICSAGDTSTWAGPICFTVPCLPQSLPYSENFNTNLGCFIVTDGGTSSDTWVHAGPGGNGNYAGDIDGTGHASVDSDNAGAAPTLVETLTSPYLQAGNVSGTLILEFDQYYNHLSSSAVVEVWDGSQWDTVLSQNTGDVGSFANPDHQYLDITQYANDSLQVRFVYNDLGSYAWYWVIDNFVVHDLVCAPPQLNTLSASNITMDSATVSWGTGGTGNETFVIWGPTGFDPTVTHLGLDTVPGTDSSYVIGGLNAATSYDFYIQDTCTGAGVSMWVGPFSFATEACEAADQCTYIADLYDSFGDGWNGAEISLMQGGSVVTTIGSGFTTGTSFPGVSIPLCDSLPTYVILSDAGSFPTEIGFDISTPWADVVASHTPGTASAGDTLGTFMSVCTPPTCPVPAQLGTTVLTADSATLVWRPGTFGNVDFEVSYGINISTPGAGSTVIASDSSFTVTALTANSSYCYFVREICAPGDTSLWAGPFCFTTPCITTVAPLSEDFENFTLGYYQGLENCWTLENTGDLASPTSGYAWELRNTSQTSSGTTTGPDRDNTLAPATGGHFFNADVSYGAAGDSAMLISPVVDISGLTSPQLTYYIHRYGTLMAALYVDVYDGTQWINGVQAHTSTTGEQTSQSDSYSEETLSLSPYANTTNLRVRFRTVSNGCCAGDNAIDDITIGEAPTCPQPTALTASNISAATADLDWIPGTSGHTDFEVSYGSGISSPGAGTSAIVTDSSYTMTGLSGSSTYCYFVREICAPGDTSLWSGPYCFNTPCVTVPAPYSQDFENFTVGHFDGGESCWDFVSNYAGTTPSGGFSWEVRNTPQTTSSNTGPAGDNTMYPATGGTWIHSDNSGASSNDSTMFTSPQVDITTVSNPQLEYHFHNYALATSTYRQPLYVDIYDGNTWHNKVHDIDSVYQSSATDPWQDTVIDLSPYNATGIVQVRFRTKITRSAGGSGDVSIDDVSIIGNAVACPRPTALATTNVGISVADLAWRPGTFGNVDFEVSIGAGISNPGAGTSVIVTDSSYGATGLSASTNYCYFVREICAVGDTSIWAGPFCFTTNVSGTSCQTVSNVTAGTAGCDEYEVNWNSNTGNSIIEYGQAGFTPGAGSVTGLVSSPYTITGLSMGTAYDVYIADVCTGDTSSYAAPLTIHTDTLPVASAVTGTDSSANGGYYVMLDGSGSVGADTYAWDFGNGSVGSGATAMGVYTASGTYTATLVVTNACGADTATVTITVTSVAENTLSRSLSVYPNPTQGDVTVEFDAQANSEATLRVMDARGRELVRTDYENVNGAFRESISLEGMAKGIYMIEISSGNLRAYRRINLQ